MSGQHAGLAGAELVVTFASVMAKAWATAQARATLAGFTAVLTETDDGRPQLVCSRWAMTRAFDNLVEVEAWLMQVEGTAA